MSHRSVYGGTTMDRYSAHNEQSTLHKMKETYWTTKQAVMKKLGKKEDAHIVASDQQLDAKLEVFEAIQTSSMDLLRAIEIYQDRLCALSQEENAMGRFLKQETQHDKTRAGKMMAAVGKAQSFSSQQRLALRVPLVRLYQEVETFRYRAISDTLVTINRMEGARTEYRGALLWMKDISEELDPDTYKQLEKFRKVQAQVKKTKAKFDKLKLDTMQKVDLLAASRCNMYSHVLANYQSTLLHFWEKTSRTHTAVAESFKGYQYYEFNMLKELAGPSKKLAAETGTKDEAERDIDEVIDADGAAKRQEVAQSKHVEAKPKTSTSTCEDEDDRDSYMEVDINASETLDLLSNSPTEAERTASYLQQLLELDAPLSSAPLAPQSASSSSALPTIPPIPMAPGSIARYTKSEEFAIEEKLQKRQQQSAKSQASRPPGGEHHELNGEANIERNDEPPAGASLIPGGSVGQSKAAPSDEPQNCLGGGVTAVEESISGQGRCQDSLDTSDLVSINWGLTTDKENPDDLLINFDEHGDSKEGGKERRKKTNKGSMNNLLEEIDKEFPSDLSKKCLTKDRSVDDPFMDFEEDKDLEEIKRKQEEEFDFTGKILQTNPEQGKAKKPSKHQGPQDLLSEELDTDETEKDDMTLLNEILNAPSTTGEDDFTLEWQAVFGNTPLTANTTYTPVEPDPANTAEFMPSSLLDLNRQVGATGVNPAGQVPMQGAMGHPAAAAGSITVPPAGPKGTNQPPGPKQAPQGKPGKQKKGQKSDMSAWFNLFADLDPLSNPDAIGRENEEITDA